MRIYLIRHGEIESNVKKIYAGTSEESLNPNGERQVVLLVSRLEGKGISRIYTSPLTRAVETAKILSQKLKIPVIVEKELREILLGPLDGLSHTQVIAQYPKVWEIWTKTPADLRLEGMEPLESVQQRILSVLKKWSLSHSEETIVAAVTHLAVLRCLLLYYQGRSLNDYRQIEIFNANAFAFDTELLRSDQKVHLRLVEEIRDV
ncbi:MAG: histidine phosphatase family protein [Thermodesulfobacteriota bacterium]|nr:MAG: histidine phosphatase family protein [Thermodesulfobacteriota bacterium]